VRAVPACSLLYRTPERNGVLDVCREYGITLVSAPPAARLAA
jgi:aryl-alcohol dehydrogenase-like predicted oxidoreductase